MASMRSAAAGSFDFLETAPENWIGVGGTLGDGFADLASRYPVVCHGLSLSIGDPPSVKPTSLSLRSPLEITWPLASRRLKSRVMRGG